MKVFLSAVEGSAPRGGLEKLIKDGHKFKWNLMSYYYIRDKNYDFAETIFAIATTTTILEITIAICDTPFLYLSKKLK